LMLAGCWFDAGWMLAGCWLDAGSMLAACRPDAGWMLARCWVDECAWYLQLDGNLQVFIEIRPECESGAHLIQSSSQNARVEHISLYRRIKPECESEVHRI
jgi:hypothetical protein